MDSQRKRIKAGSIAEFLFRLACPALVALWTAQNATAGADPGACSAYARGAVAQNEENLRRGCGYGGPRWQSNYDNHYGWCIREGWMFDGTAAENNARSEGLAKCQPKAAPAGASEPSSAPVTPSPPPPAPPVVEKRDSGARFSSISGQVEVRRGYNPDEIVFASGKTILYVGDEVITGEDSSAVISFADFSTLMVKAEAEIIIAIPPEAPGKLELIKGRLLTNIKKIMNGEPIEIKSNLATCGIKGTVVDFDSDGDKRNTIKVYEGVVEVASRISGDRVALKRGQQVVATPRGLEPVVSFDVEKELKGWTSSFPGPEMKAASERALKGVGAKASGSSAAAPPPPTGDTPQQPDATDSYGFWAVNEGADGVKIGTIFPDYSSTEFTGAVMYCIPRSGVRISVDSPKKLTPGASAKVAVDIDGASTVYKGTAKDKPTEDGSVVVFNTSFNDPLLEELSAAKSVTFSVNKAKLPLPMKNLQKSFKSFFDKCQK